MLVTDSEHRAYILPGANYLKKETLTYIFPVFLMGGDENQRNYFQILRNLEEKRQRRRRRMTKDINRTSITFWI